MSNSRVKKYDVWYRRKVYDTKPTVRKVTEEEKLNIERKVEKRVKLNIAQKTVDGIISVTERSSH